MEYIKVSVKVCPLNTIVNELMMAQMGDLGFDSFQDTDDGFEAYIPNKDYDSNILSSLECPIENTQLEYATELIADQNWNKEWEENFFQPIIIGERCIIHSTFHEVNQKCEFDIIVNPQMAFGTGHHETTKLMVEQILDNDFHNLEVLDMGCGTAILGILCAQKNAKKITGIDIDEWAYNNAIENLKLNNVSNMEVLLGGADLLSSQQYDVVLANINRNILLNDMHAYAKVLKPGGRIIFSGFYDEDVPVMEKEANKYGFQLLSQKTENKWTSLAYILPK